METSKGEDDNDNYKDEHNDNGNLDLLSDLGEVETSKGGYDNDDYEDEHSENGNVDLLPDLSEVETPQPRLHTKPQLKISVTCQIMKNTVTITRAVIMVITNIVILLIITIMIMMSSWHQACHQARA